MQLLFFT